MALKEADKRKPCFKHLHFTIMDLKPAALARVLIFFHIMARIDTESVESGNNATDTCLAMAYLFCCQVIPPFAEEILQSSIKELIKKLEGREATTPVTYVPEQDRKSIIRVLRQWQEPWHKLSEVADVRNFIEQALREFGQNTPLCFDKRPGNDGGPEVVDFEKLSTLLPPVAVVKRREPSLAKLIPEYRSTGRSKKLQQHIGLNWRVNSTLLDYDYADRNLGLPDDGPFTFEFHPVTAIQSMGALDPKTKSKTSALERLGEVFRHMSISAFTFGREKRLVVEMIIGEVTDVMDRIRYNVLDHRLSTPTKNGTLDPTTFPQTFDYVHMSNIP